MIRSERGDTIVEVLITIVIVSSVLVGAYNVATRSSQSTQDASERSQALQIAQAQVEYLRTAHTIPATSQCFLGDATPNGAPAECTISPNGAGTEPAFKVSIDQPTASNGNAYQVHVNWTALDSVPANVTLAYRPEAG